MRRWKGIVFTIAVILVINLPSMEILGLGPDPSQLEYHDNMSIVGDEELKLRSVHEGWAGSGTKADPINIQGYLLTTDMFRVGLYLRNITLHLVIEDCIFNVDAPDDVNYQAGMLTLHQGSNITVRNCSFISDRINALSVLQSRDCTIEGCDIYVGNGGSSLIVSSSKGISILGCNITGEGSFRISASSCRGLNLLDNSFFSDRTSISILNSNNTMLINNFISKANGNGFEIGFGSVHAESNIISGRSDFGFFLYYVDEAILVNNRIGRSFAGIYAWYCKDTGIHGNIIGPSDISIAMRDPGSVNLSGNEMSKGGLYIFGELESFDDLTISDDNLISGRRLFFRNNCDLEGEVINYKDIAEIILVNVSNCTLYNLELYDCFVPINLARCRDISIASCSINNSNGAIMNFHSERIQVLQNRIIDCDDGLYIINSNRSVYRENEISTNWNGFDIRSSEGSVYEDNKIGCRYYGFYVRSSVNDSITGNSITSGEGFFFRGQMGLELSGNLLDEGNMEFQSSFYLDTLLPEPSGNIVQGREALYIFDRVGDVIDLEGRDLHSLHLMNCSDVVLKGLHTSGKVPIEVHHSSGVLFMNSSINGNGGMYFRRCSNATLKGIDFNGVRSDEALLISRSENVIVENCTFEDLKTGINLDRSTNSVVENCSFHKVEYTAVSITNQSEGIEIRWCSIDISDYQGIHVHTSYQNTIYENVISNCSSYGVFLDRDSSNNSIYLNRFSYNSGSHFEYDSSNIQVLDMGHSNDWCLDKGDLTVGNIWMDHQGPDENNDGIVDTPYWINKKNRVYDKYPDAGDLIEPSVPESDESNDKGIGKIAWNMIFLTIGLLIITAYFSMRLLITRRE